MNTLSVLKTDKAAFRKKLTDLMFTDGFGFDEALDHAVDYADIIFGKCTATACLRVREALRQMRKEALEVYTVVWREYEDGKVGERKTLKYVTVEEATREGYIIFQRKETFAAWLILPSGTSHPFVQGGLYI